jgi:rRNA-processing protein FCF1
MIPTRLHLKDGTNPANVAKTLQNLIADAQNLSSLGSDIDRFRNEYLAWVERTQSQLLNWTYDFDALTMLQTPSYWQISQSIDNTPRPWPLIKIEIDFQISALARIVEDLEKRIASAAEHGGVLAVLDTNILLEYQPLAAIPWTHLLDYQQLHLIIPLRVIEELDAKKYSDRRRLAKRARRILPQLEHLLRTDNGKLASGVTVGVPVDPGPRQRPVDADEEILLTCRELKHLGGRDVIVVTGDTGMLLRADAIGLKTVTMPEEHLRNRDDSTDGA